MSSKNKAPPPQLVFDDGSRAMQSPSQPQSTSRPQEAPKSTDEIRYHYEIDRLVQELQSLWQSSDFRVAVQFPDHLLSDAPQVCWALEQDLRAQTTTTRDQKRDSTNLLVFCLGDTTFASCCPDTTAAAHLQADCLVHYGPACLSTTCTSIPVLYSFGRDQLAVQTCVTTLLQPPPNDTVPRRFLILYQVEYHHAMEDLQTRLSEQGDALVLLGQIPSLQGSTTTTTIHNDGCGAKVVCCQRDSSVQSTDNHDSQHSSTDKESAVPNESKDTKNEADDTLTGEDFIVGGLELPCGKDDMDWSTFTLLFIGDDTSRQYMNIVLRFLSSANPQRVIANYWTYRPDTESLTTTLSPVFQRKLNRRFYLIQKAQQASVFGVLVANFSDSARIQTVVHSVQALIEHRQKSSYIFVVGKINPAKLANFAEIECFVLVACPEHSLLEDEREDFHKPILTPYELSIALGINEWGSDQYSLDVRDYLKSVQGSQALEWTEQQEDDDEDAPYFSLVTGRYEQASTTLPAKMATAKGTSLPHAAGEEGTLAKYHSVAADFLKQREYQGLELPDPNTTKVHAAVPGQQGIASNYGK